MKSQQTDIVEHMAEWLDKSGFTGDLSALTASLHDIQGAIEKIYDTLLPALLRLNTSQKEEALDIIIKCWLEMEHIDRHANSAVAVLTAARDFLDES
jgi:hypothetical protein